MPRRGLLVLVLLVVGIVGMAARHAYITSRFIGHEPKLACVAGGAHAADLANCDHDPPGNAAIAEEQNRLYWGMLVDGFVATLVTGALVWGRLRGRAPRLYVGQLIVVWIGSILTAYAGFVIAYFVLDTGSRIASASVMPYVFLVCGVIAGVAVCAVVAPLLVSWVWRPRVVP